MSLQSWIENLVSLELDFSEVELTSLKDATKQLYDVLKAIIDGKDKRDRFLRPYKSAQAREIVKSFISRHPDSFYNYQDENVTICVYARSGGRSYSVQVRDYEFPIGLLKSVFAPVSLFDETTFTVTMDYRTRYRYYFSFTPSELPKCVYCFRKMVEIYVQQSDSNKIIEQVKRNFF